MVARKSHTAIDHSHDSIVLDWIVSDDNELRCKRCGVSARIERVGSYSDGIPMIQLPYAWFLVHGNPNHPVQLQPEPQSEPQSELEPQSEPPKPLDPITPDEARRLSGADAQRILCGVPRKEVLRHRQAVLAGLEKEID